MKLSTVVLSLFVNAATVSVMAATTTVRALSDPFGLGERSPFEASAAAPAPASNPLLTNGQRFANGMPPLKPRHMHDAFAKRQQGASVVYQSGTLSAYVRGSGAFAGYVAASMGTNRFWTLTQDPSLALPISYTKSAGLNDINQLNTAYGFPEFGASVSQASGGSDFAAGSSNFAVLTATAHTNAGSPPSQGGNRYISTQPIESDIWTYEITTGEFTPHWVNNDGSSPPTYVVIINSNQGLFITGDVTALANDFGANTQVDLFLT